LAPGTAPSARADLVLDFISVAASPSTPGHFRWTYNLSIGPQAQANQPGVGSPGFAAPNQGAPNPGDFLTLYDFRGFDGTFGVSSTTAGAPSDWTLSSQLLGPTPGSGVDDHFAIQLPVDNAGFSNLTLRKTGGSPVTNPPSNLILTFFADSEFDVPGLGNYSSANHVLAPGSPTNNQSQSRTSNIIVPLQGSATPEPGTLLLFGAGIAMVMRARRRKLVDAA
jgi:hypothetical protein